MLLDHARNHYDIILHYTKFYYIPCYTIPLSTIICQITCLRSFCSFLGASPQVPAANLCRSFVNVARGLSGRIQNFQERLGLQGLGRI